jgi:hypothetical protein
MDDRSPEVRFALDSPLEESGFELLVPMRMNRFTRPHLRLKVELAADSVLREAGLEPPVPRSREREPPIGTGSPGPRRRARDDQPLIRNLPRAL